MATVHLTPSNTKLKPGDLFGGEPLRVAIARELIVDPAQMPNQGERGAAAPDIPWVLPVDRRQLEE